MTNYVNVNCLTIAYDEIRPDAPLTLFFIHGNSGSKTTWRYQWTAPELSSYRLIAFDLPGHGLSSNSERPNEDYSPIGTAKIITEAIQQLHAGKPYVLIGFSYGTNLIAELLHFGIKLIGMVMLGMCCIGETCPMNRVFRTHDQPSVFFYNEPNRAMVYQFIFSLLYRKEAAEALTDEYRSTHPSFRPALVKAASEGRVTDEVGRLEKSAVPLCIVFGRDDNLIDTNYLRHIKVHLWKNHFHLIEKAGHFVHLDQPNPVNQLIAEYTQAVFTKTHVELHNQ